MDTDPPGPRLGAGLSGRRIFQNISSVARSCGRVRDGVGPNHESGINGPCDHFFGYTDRRGHQSKNGDQTLIPLSLVAASPIVENICICPTFSGCPPESGIPLSFWSMLSEYRLTFMPLRLLGRYHKSTGCRPQRASLSFGHFRSAYPGRFLLA